MDDKVVEIPLSHVNEMLGFIGASEHLPPGWTVARVAHLISRVQREAAVSRDGQPDVDHTDMPAIPPS